MKHAVILAHPKPTSFCAAIARTCVEHLRATNHDVILRDLYGLDFDPRLKAEELPSQSGAQPAADIVAERGLIGDVDSFIFVYPFWFNAPPAILKGYVDRVFSMGFGYAPSAGGAQSLLDDKTLLSFSTSGAPEHWVNSTGALKALMTVFDLHLSGVCGLRVLGHEHFGSIVSNITEESVADMLDQVRTRLDDLFAPTLA
ncbi:NAD(P)H-dependent oxidoreductase [Caulobacter sp.]|uniref:NAD(P)H-dependent oxidoreductase n=1 Tax=Caulobacter sp. TaxID=78 RepID=UPI003BB115C4